MTNPKKSYINREYEVTTKVVVTYQLNTETETEAGELLDFEIDAPGMVHDLFENALHSSMLVGAGEWGYGRTMDVIVLNASDITGE